MKYAEYIRDQAENHQFYYERDVVKRLIEVNAYQRKIVLENKYYTELTKIINWLEEEGFTVHKYEHTTIVEW